MNNPRTILTIIDSCLSNQPKIEPIGSHVHYAKLFLSLCNNISGDCLYLLCSTSGLIIASWPTQLSSQYVGRSINMDLISKSADYASFFEKKDKYILIAEKETLNTKETVSILEKFNHIIEILDEANKGSNYLLSALDSVNKSISIYDQHANILFANKNFCNYLYINNRDNIIGRNIDDVVKEAGTTIQSIDTNTNHLKMHDVLSYGKEVIDWEVRVTSSRGDTQLVGNDMYPVRDSNGNITGMVEITHSRRQLLANAKKLAGLSAEYTFENIIGNSKAIKDVIRTAKDYANSPLSLLITGESGVGKELFAQSVHNYSNRRKGPFVALNCASFPENLIESELFGYVGGAFTGASKGGQIGKFELADGGTLFLDEIGELPFHFQSKLLRVLETWTVTRIGGSKPSPVNVRIIAATNRNLLQMVEEGLFRQDLYYRLQILNIIIPPLKMRKEDIFPLAESLLQQGKDPESNSVKSLTDEAKDLLIAYDWPGNVRELRNVLYRASLLSKSDFITREILESSISATGAIIQATSAVKTHSSEQSPEERLKKCQEQINSAHQNMLEEAISIANGNKSKAAEILNMSRNTFYRMLKKYNIE